LRSASWFARTEGTKRALSMSKHTKLMIPLPVNVNRDSLWDEFSIDCFVRQLLNQPPPKRKPGPIQFLKIREVAERLRCTPRSIRRRVNDARRAEGENAAA
jgi:hypothetical protein